MRENHENRSVSSYGSYMEVQGEDLILIWKPEEHNVFTVFSQMLWHVCANNKNNCLQFAQQLTAYGLLIKTDESILT